MIQTTVQHGAAMRDRLVSFADPTSPSSKKQSDLALQDVERSEREQQDVQDGRHERQDAGQLGGEGTGTPPAPAPEVEVADTAEVAQGSYENENTTKDRTDQKQEAATAGLPPPVIDENTKAKEPEVREQEQQPQTGQHGEVDGQPDSHKQNLEKPADAEEELPENSLKEKENENGQNELNESTTPSPYEDPQTKNVDDGATAGGGQQQGHDGKEAGEQQEVATTTAATQFSQVAAADSDPQGQHPHPNPTSPTRTTTTKVNNVENADTISVGSSDAEEDSVVVISDVNLCISLQLKLQISDSRLQTSVRL